MSNRQINALTCRMWRELSRHHPRPAVLRELFKRLIRAHNQYPWDAESESAAARLWRTT